MNKGSILQFIQTKFPGEDLYGVNVYGSKSVPCWAPCQEFATNATTNTDNNILQFTTMQPRNGDRIDETKVAVRTIMLRHANNQCDTDVALRSNYIHPAFEETESLFAKMVSASGAPGGAFVTIPKGYNKGLPAYSLKYDEESLYLNPAFIKTMMHVNNINIMNGIQLIDPELCGRAQLPKSVTVYTPNGTKTREDAECYYAIPPDHILAWTLDMTDEQRAKHGSYALELLVKDRLMYYLVPDWCFLKLYKIVEDNWLGKVHLVSMHDLAIEFIPRDPTVELKKVSIQMTFSFTGSPTVCEETLSDMAPVTHADFPLFRQTAAAKTEEEDYMEMIAEQERKMKEIKI